MQLPQTDTPQLQLPNWDRWGRCSLLDSISIYHESSFLMAYVYNLIIYSNALQYQGYLMAGYGHKSVTLLMMFFWRECFIYEPATTCQGRWIAAKQRSLWCGPRLLSDHILSLWVNRMQGVVYTFRKDLPNSHKGLRSHTEVGKKWLFRGPIIALLDSQPGTFPPYSQSTL